MLMAIAGAAAAQPLEDGVATVKRGEYAVKWLPTGELERKCAANALMPDPLARRVPIKIRMSLPVHRYTYCGTSECRLLGGRAEVARTP